MNNSVRSETGARCAAHAAVVAVLLLAGGCAEFGFSPPPPPPPVPAEPVPPPVAPKPIDALPSLDVVILAHHRQCEAPASKVGLAEDAKQLRDLMQWLKRSCNLGEANLAPQLGTLKQLRHRHKWPEAYAAWLDEWRRHLLRMQALQQRAATAEAAQANMVKRLRAIERDLTTRP